MTVSSKVSAFLAVGALLLVGCSDSSDDASADTSTTTMAPSQQSKLDDGVYAAFVHDVVDIDGTMSVTIDLLDEVVGQEAVDAIASDGVIDDFSARVDELKQFGDDGDETTPTIHEDFLDGFSYLVNPDPSLLTLPVADTSQDLTFTYVVLGPPDVLDPAQDGPIIPNTTLLTLGLTGETVDPATVQSQTSARAGTADLNELGAAARLSHSGVGEPVAEGVVLQPLSEQSGTPFTIEVKNNAIVSVELQSSFDMESNHVDEWVLFNSWLNEDNDAVDEFMNAPLPYGQYSARVSSIDPESEGDATITYVLVGYESIDTDADTTVTLGKDRQTRTTDVTTFEASIIGREPSFLSSPADYESLLTTGVVDPEYGATGPVTDFYIQIEAARISAISNIKFS